MDSPTSEIAIDELTPEARLALVGKLIDDGAKLSAITAHFKSEKEAIAAIAIRRGGRFGIAAARSAPCCACGASAAKTISVGLMWGHHGSQIGIDGLSLAGLLVGHIPIPLQDVHTQFRTHHPFCIACWRVWSQSIRRRQTLHNVSRFLIPIGLLALLAGGLAYAAMDPKNDDRERLLTYGIAGSVALPLGLAAWAWGRRPPLPESIRHLAGGPFSLESARELT